MKARGTIETKGEEETTRERKLVESPLQHQTHTLSSLHRSWGKFHLTSIAGCYQPPSHRRRLSLEGTPYSCQGPPCERNRQKHHRPACNIEKPLPPPGGKWLHIITVGLDKRNRKTDKMPPAPTPAAFPTLAAYQFTLCLMAAYQPTSGMGRPPPAAYYATTRISQCQCTTYTLPNDTAPTYVGKREKP